ncbi:MAG: hypothetical protein KY455_05010 [Euryarchaeota archaeon]|nr:hypothetical protein [Euryarchaeota archaeon]
MRGVLFAILFVVSTVLAGCISEGDAPQTTSVAEEEIIKDDGKIKVKDIKVDLDRVPSLDEPPQWRLGQWWKYRMTDSFTQQETIFYRVVAGQENDTGSYLVGMPTHGFSNAVMVLHIPGFGQIDRQTLGFELHDCMLDPLKFPIEDGAQWESEFECGDVQITATVTSDTTAEFVMAPHDPEGDGGGGRGGTYSYDAEIGVINKMTINNYAQFEVIEHGHDFHLVEGWEGNVTVPYAHDVIFMHGRIGMALKVSPDGIAPGTEPWDEVVVPEGYDRVSFAIILGDALNLLTQGQAKGMGHYTERATAPDDEVYYLEYTGDGIRTVAYKNDNPSGTWRFEHLTAGPGIAMAEGIAYSVFDIQLPIGKRIEGVLEHEHPDGKGH